MIIEMDNPLICIYCSKTFSNKGNLKRHTETSKTCLLNRNINVVFNYKCEYCEYKTNLNYDFEKHKLSCKKYIKALQEKVKEQSKQIEMKDLEIKIKDECNKKIENICSRPQTNNITFVNQLNYSKKTLSDYSEVKNNLQQLVDDNYNENTFFKGIEGVTSLVVKALKPENKTYYLCYDKTGLFHRSVNSKIDYDDKANKLLDDVLPLVSTKITQISEDITKKYETLRDTAEYSVKNIQDEEKKETLLNQKLSLIDDMENTHREQFLSNNRIIHRLKDMSSTERHKCVKQLSNVLCIPKGLLKSDPLPLLEGKEQYSDDNENKYSNYTFEESDD